MRVEGRVFKVGRRWAIEVPILSVFSQGRTRKEAYEMIADAIESLVNKRGFEVRLYPGKDEYFEVGVSDDATLCAFLLRQARLRAGLTLAAVARRLGSKSVNAYARYEQGRTVPSVSKLSELLSAVAPEKDLVLVESRARHGGGKRRSS